MTREDALNEIVRLQQLRQSALTTRDYFNLEAEVATVEDEAAKHRRASRNETLYAIEYDTRIKRLQAEHDIEPNYFNLALDTHEGA